MPPDDDQQQNQTAAEPTAAGSHATSPPDEEVSLVDELGVKTSRDQVFSVGKRYMFASGRESPVAEIVDNGVVFHAAKKPLSDQQIPEVCAIENVNELGLVLGENGQPKRVGRATYNGKSLYYLSQDDGGIIRHYAVFIDEQNITRKLLWEGVPMTTTHAWKLYGRTHDGEFSVFPQITAEM